MNGISLAALLGAATWFGSKAVADRNEESSEDSALAAVAGPEMGDAEEAEYEFFWPQNALFQ